VASTGFASIKLLHASGFEQRTVTAFTLFLLYFNGLHCVNQHHGEQACPAKSVKLARGSEFSA
jgi:hypothetical protein